MSVEAARPWPRPRHGAGAIAAHRGNINSLTICLLFSIKWAPIIPRKEPKPSWRETQKIVVRAFTLRSSHTQCSGGQPTVKCFQSAFGEEGLKHVVSQFGINKVHLIYSIVFLSRLLQYLQIQLRNTVTLLTISYNSLCLCSKTSTFTSESVCLDTKIQTLTLSDVTKGLLSRCFWPHLEFSARDVVNRELNTQFSIKESWESSCCDVPNATDSTPSKCFSRRLLNQW